LEILLFAFLDQFTDIGLGEPIPRSLGAATHVDVTQFTVADERGQLLLRDAQPRCGLGRRQQTIGRAFRYFALAVRLLLRTGTDQNPARF